MRKFKIYFFWIILCCGEMFAVGYMNVFGCWGNVGFPMKVTVPDDSYLLSRTKTNLTVLILRIK